MALDLTTMTLQVTDNGDGTVNWLAVGAGVGQNVALLKAPWTFSAGSSLVWAQVATATADGTGNASGTNLSAGGYGFYGWQAVRLATAATADRLTNTVLRPAVDPSDPVHSRILGAFVSGIRTLNLAGIGNAVGKVFMRWFPDYLDGTDNTAAGGAGLPMIQVAPYPREVPMGYMTNRDDVGYPVLVAFFDSAGPKLDNNMPRNLKWRRQVAALFRNQQLAGVPEVVLIDWQPDAIVASDWLRSNYLAGAMVFQVRSRETRGLIA